MSIPYRFMPWARSGLARSHSNADSNTALAARPKVKVGLTLQAKQDGNPASAVAGGIELALYGPGDIIGIDPRLVVRTDPKPNCTNFEPNYLAIIDFDPPDFPWLLTPAKANVNHQLRPWLVLVVVERSLVALPSLKPGAPLPSITLTAAQVATQLPNLDESWLWAHAQAVSTATTAGTLATELPQQPAQNISRLVCPRRLEARKNYLACVVPAFDAGRRRGLGQPLQGDTLMPAWDHDHPIDTELPVYTHWEFSTGPLGDIETLARRLMTPEKYKDNKDLLEQLGHIGEQPVAVDAERLLFEGDTPGRTVFEGALVSLDFEPDAANGVFADKLAGMLNSGDALAADGTPKEDIVPTLSPPLYGEYPAKLHHVEPGFLNQRWFDQLNLQPRYRLAAGWGAEIVRQNQDEFMQAAWAQVGEVLATQRALSLSRFSHDVLKAIETRHLNKLSDTRLLAVLAPARARLKLDVGNSLYGRIDSTSLPDELFDGAMRRLTSPRRATLRMAQWREHNLALAPIAQQVAGLVTRFASISKNLTRLDPNRFVPDGIMGSRSYDAIPLPADRNSMVELAPYTGLPGSLSGADIERIQQANITLRRKAAGLKQRAPLMGDVWHQGILTETHRQRLAQLQQMSAEPLQGDFAQLIRQASKNGAEGLLMTVQTGGAVQTQALKIDGRNGNLKTVGSAFTSGSGRKLRSVRIAPGSVAAVPLQALRLYGNNAVFTSLPPGTLGQGGAPVRINLDAPGQFGAASAGAVPSITLPPAVKERAVLHRYSEAFKDYQKLWREPNELAQIGIQPVDFALTQAVQQTRARIDPALTVPARLASMLALGEQNVAWARSSGLSNSYIAERFDSAIADLLRYVIPPRFDRIMAYPELPFPLSKKLEKLAPDVFLPGVDALPDDFIMAVQTNPRFVEALLLGANHEMGRELLWQGFPTDQRGTPFQHFWQRLDGSTDITAIHTWRADRQLGKQSGGKAMLVLLIRGQLLERFPTLSIYAYPKLARQARPGGKVPPVPPGSQPPDTEMLPELIEMPVLKGHLGKDITYLGFNINPDRDPAIANPQDDLRYMGNFFFVLEEQMTEPRFGFDEPDKKGQAGAGWLSVDWSEVGDAGGVAGGQYFGSAQLKQAPPAQGQPDWQNPHAATIANALLQRPFRGYYAGAALKMPKP